MVALREEAAGPAEVTVEAPGQADVQALHAAREGAPIVRLADEVKMLALQAELDEPEPEPFAARGDAPAHDTEGAAVAQRPDHGPESDGDMSDVVARDGAARTVRHAGAGRPWTT